MKAVSKSIPLTEEVLDIVVAALNNAPTPRESLLWRVIDSILAFIKVRVLRGYHVSHGGEWIAIHPSKFNNDT